MIFFNSKKHAHFIASLISALAILAVSTNAHAQSSSAGPASFGYFEASGARIGMEFGLALDAIAATKPIWAARIEAQRESAMADCSQGKAILILASNPTGRPSAALEAKCVRIKDGVVLSEMAIKTSISHGLTLQEIQAALASRYGQPSSSVEAPGATDLIWNAPDSASPSAPVAETLSARLETRAIDGSPSALSLRLSSLPSKSSQGFSPKERAFQSLPF